MKNYQSAESEGKKRMIKNRENTRNEKQKTHPTGDYSISGKKEFNFIQHSGLPGFSGNYFFYFFQSRVNYHQGRLSFI